MKKIYALLLILIFQSLAVCAEEVPVYVIIGQSNAAGWSGGYGGNGKGPDPENTAGRGQTSDEIVRFYGENGVDSAYIFNPASTLPGHWAKQYWKNKNNDLTALLGGGRDVGAPLAMFHRKAFPQSPVYIIKHAAGGTSIGCGGGQWNIMDGDKNTGSLWYQFKHNKFIPALQSLLAQGKTPVVKGIFWMQGESDADIHKPEGNLLPGIKRMTVKQYEEHLGKLIERLKTEFVIDSVNYVTPKTKFLIGTISTLDVSGGKKGQKRYTPNVRKAQENLTKRDRQIVLIKNDDCQINGTGNDGIHFNDDDFYSMAQKILKATEPKFKLR